MKYSSMRGMESAHVTCLCMFARDLRGTVIDEVGYMATYGNPPVGLFTFSL